MWLPSQKHRHWYMTRAKSRLMRLIRNVRYIFSKFGFQKTQTPIRTPQSSQGWQSMTAYQSASNYQKTCFGIVKIFTALMLVNTPITIHSAIATNRAVLAALLKAAEFWAMWRVTWLTPPPESSSQGKPHTTEYQSDWLTKNRMKKFEWKSRNKLNQYIG